MKNSAFVVGAVALLACACSVDPAGDDVVADFPPPPSFGGSGGETTGPIFEAGATGFPQGEPFTDPIVVASPPPPPVSGGTLLVLENGRTAVVSDPDHDQVLVVDLDARTLSAPIALSPGDEPGRLAEDAAGRVHVVLRGSGVLATIDPVNATLVARRSVCTAARGVAYDPASDSVHVACAEGILVTLPAAGGNATRTLSIADDLRDVVVENKNLWVSRFRAAEVLRIDAAGQIAERMRPPASTSATGGTMTPQVAWRMIAARNGGIIVVHQLAQTTDVVIQPGGYGSGFGCGGIVASTVTEMDSGQLPRTLVEGLRSPLPVDVVEPADGSLIVASARNMTNPSLSFGFPALARVLAFESQLSATSIGLSGCGQGDTPPNIATPSGQVVAVAIAGSRVVAQTREPSLLIIGQDAIVLPGTSRMDTGHFLFHAATQAGLACASCHPEGHEDGHVWSFANMGPRRTQSISGGFLGTAPFHWNGEMRDFTTLVHDVMQERMSGPVLSPGHVEAFGNWIDKIPALRPAPQLDAAAAARGKLLFSSTALGCTTCHTGPRLTDNINADVGTGGPFQVPSLTGLFWRAPYMHNGCAATLADRFGSCGGTRHGNTSTLSVAALGDLTAYLATL